HPDTGALQIRQVVDGQAHSEIVPLTVQRIVIDGGPGNDRVRVRALRADVTVEAKNVEQLNVGNNGSLADVLGTMTLYTDAGGPSTAVTLDDSAGRTSREFDIDRNEVSDSTYQDHGWVENFSVNI